MSDKPALTQAEVRSHRLAVGLLVPLVVLLLAIVAPLYLLYDVVRVDGDSMAPTLRDQEYLLVTKDYGAPRRGDVIVVHLRMSDGRTIQIVKRVVAIAGDQVSVRGDMVTVNGRPEEFAHESVILDTTYPAADYVIPEGHVYAMGDNRPLSADSRYAGALPLGDIHGRAVAVWFPINRVRLIPSP